MQSTVIIVEELPKTTLNQIENDTPKSGINGNYLILSAIALFCCLLLFLGLPFWTIFVFGIGMSFVLFLLYLIRGIQIVLDLNEKELQEAIEEDLFN